MVSSKPQANPNLPLPRNRKHTPQSLQCLAHSPPYPHNLLKSPLSPFSQPKISRSIRPANSPAPSPRRAHKNAPDGGLTLKENMQILTLGIGVGLASAYISYSPEIAVRPKVEDKAKDLTPPISRMMMGSPSKMRYTTEAVWDDFGDDPFAVPDVAVPTQLSNSVIDTSPACKTDEDIMIKALVENSAVDWNRQIAYGAGRGFGMRGRMMDGRSFGSIRLASHCSTSFIWAR